MLAIIPARAGSKGVPGKNKRDFCGRPLIEWTIDAACSAKCVSKVLVTTDDIDIIENKNIADKVDILLKRPANISGDDAPATQYIEHALNHVSSIETFEYFCILQPTSPLRVGEDIEVLYKKVLNQKLNSGVTVVNVPHCYAPKSLMEMREEIVIPTEYNLKESNLRQEQKSYVARNGAAVYVCKVKHFVNRKSLFAERMAYHLMPNIRSIDIDTEEDFEMAEIIMKDKLKCV
ncbi:cytidylyltransferase domain-containing protein [Neptuniibacter sp. QD29_5]|uniref:acylneuraminate cytidylyltransferase family protein n=1 Tax=Neptuniibacter sp. QD29_5 TaxID=3398207 RepID=UPI0039F4647E